MRQKVEGRTFIRFFAVSLVVTLMVLQEDVGAQRRSLRSTSRFVTQQRKPQVLEKGKSVQANLRQGESTSYAIRLTQGQYVHVLIEQQGFDLKASVSDRTKKEIIRVDSANRLRGPEEIEFVAETSGQFLVKVEAAKYGSAGGRYQLHVADVHEANEKEKELHRARILHDKSVNLKDKGEYDEALKVAEQALNIRENILGKEHLEVASSLNDLGDVRYRKDDLDGAEQAYQRALNIREKLLKPLDPDIAASLDGLGLVYYAQRNYDKADPLLRRALGIWEKALGPLNPNVAEPLDSIGGIYEAKGEFDKAEETYKRALSVREKGLDPGHPAIAASLSNLALMYHRNGQYSKAEPLYLRALPIIELQGKDHPEVAFVLNNLALLYRVKGNYAEAEKLYQRVLKIREKEPGIQHQDYATTLNNLAMVYNAKADYEKAEPLFLQALSTFQTKLGHNDPLVATALNNLAVLYAAKGDHAKAEQMYKSALKAREDKFGLENIAVAVSLDNLALLYMGDGDYGKAEPLLLRAQSIVDKNPNPEHPEVARTYNILGLLDYSRGDYQKAEPFLRRALLIRSKALGTNHPDVASSDNNLAFLYEATGHITDAIESRVRGNDISENNIELNITTGSQRQKLLFLDTLSSETNATVSLHTQSAPTSPAALKLAFTTVLRRKGRALEAMTDSIATLRKRLDPRKQALIDELIDMRSYLSSLFVRGPGRLTSSQYQDLVKKIQDRIDELEAEVSSKSAEVAIQNTPVTLELVQKAMPPNSALVEFVLYKPINVRATTTKDRTGAARYAAYVLPSKGEPLWANLGEAEKVDDTINSTRGALRDPARREEVKPLARKLDELVMAPVRRILRNETTLFLSPDALLNLVPFGALVDEQDRFLIERYSFIYLTSGRDLLRTKASTKSQNSVVFADPDFGPEIIAAAATTDPSNSCLSSVYFKPLPGTAAQAEALRGLIPGATILTRRQPTEAAIKRVKGPRILHVATHGFFLSCSESGRPLIASAPDTMGGTSFMAEDQLLANDHRSGELEDALLRSGLAFTDANRHKGGNDDGILTALEAASLNLWGTKLVVLSACDTGIGAVKSGEGVYGLRRALVLAGSESQVISLWQVSDRATRDLMVGYYRELNSGQGRSEALRQIQLCMLKSEDRWHPYYWAGFIHSGDWDALGNKPLAKSLDCRDVFR
ncbi:MAG: hypothetical protein QOH70_3254 [Blastocatellia bacterium]|jgi:CHAT domain-containing protein/tetratricopeptide (TPR) repeat protein|nr:hypothetical protein [Blastocatellia bacterium]